MLRQISPKWDLWLITLTAWDLVLTGQWVHFLASCICDILATTCSLFEESNAIRKMNGFFRFETESWRRRGRLRVISIHLAQNISRRTLKILNKNKVSIPAFVRNGTTVTKDFDKASMLNQYFSECFNMAQLPLSSRYEEPNIGNCPCSKEWDLGYDELLSNFSVPKLQSHWISEMFKKLFFNHLITPTVFFALICT